MQMIQTQNTKKNIAVIFGGHSSEYKVSLQSAAAVISHMEHLPYNIILIGITKEGQWFRYFGSTDHIENDTWQSGRCIPAIISPDASHHGLMEFYGVDIHFTHIDAAFPVLHGKNGEDGTIQGLLAMANIPCIGCGPLSSALCMDKDIAHRLASQAGIKVPRSIVLHDYDRISGSELARNVEAMGYPVFVKPANAGSSFGITRVIHSGQLTGALKAAFAHDHKVLIEESVDGFEVGCAVCGRESLIIGEVDEIELSEGFFDYNEKYTLKTSKIHMPARISDEDKKRIKETALLLYRTLECDIFARVDMFFTKQKNIVFNEINTIPGFTAHSRYPGMMKGAGMDFDTIIKKLVEVAL